MKATTRTLRNGADDHAAAMEQIAAAAHRTVDSVSESARALEENVRFRTTELGSYAREQEKRARAMAERTKRRALTYLRRQPLRGAGIAAGVALLVGAALGALLLRR